MPRRPRAWTRPSATRRRAPPRDARALLRLARLSLAALTPRLPAAVARPPPGCAGRVDALGARRLAHAHHRRARVDGGRALRRALELVATLGRRDQRPPHLADVSRRRAPAALRCALRRGSLAVAARRALRSAVCPVACCHPPLTEPRACRSPLRWPCARSYAAGQVYAAEMVYPLMMSWRKQVRPVRPPVCRYRPRAPAPRQRCWAAAQAVAWPAWPSPASPADRRLPRARPACRLAAARASSPSAAT